MMPYFFNLTNSNLTYLDILTYVAIKSFDNSNNDCFPSYETIAERAGLGRTFISESIGRLETSNFIKIDRRGYQKPNKCYPNRYSFTIDKDYFCQIPHEIFKTTDLTNCERAMLLALRQFAVTPYQLYGSLKEIAHDLHLPLTTINKQYYSLVKKGYLDKSSLKRKVTLLTSRIDWDYTAYLTFEKPAKLPELTLMIA
ncbi:helix-turn-helix domain-containing protein [Pedobacter sp. ISL-68]|nr:helix-turn-helix domain-containing protein [Pedobacter sp. ISL-68]